MRQLKNYYNIIKAYSQLYLLSWKTKHNILVIESDDWGSIRTSSKKAFQDLVNRGYNLKASPYAYDALETEEDLQKLFSILNSIMDYRGRKACFTANMILANPDFKAISESQFKTFHYENVDETLNRIHGNLNVAKLWNEGIITKSFIPQLHGLHHIQSKFWLEDLKNDNTLAHLTFDLGMCGIPKYCNKEYKSYYGPVFNEEHYKEEFEIEDYINNGFNKFYQQFGYYSDSVIAPNYCWADYVEKKWNALGIKYIQGNLFQVIGRESKRQSHFIGKKTRFGGVNLVRNCTFEPIINPENAVEKCLREIDLSFKLRIPATVCSHRVNYVGTIDPLLRNKNLRLLKKLLLETQKRWPTVIFLSAPELGYLIQNPEKESLIINNNEYYNQMNFN